MNKEEKAISEKAPVKLLYMNDHSMFVGKVKFGKDDKGGNQFTIYYAIKVEMQGLNPRASVMPATILTFPASFVLSEIRQNCIEKGIMEFYDKYQDALAEAESGLSLPAKKLVSPTGKEL
ncbi:MAG: hypothetical protein KAR06_11245 [Deltaproteobacteria bacterium]|nr:hypothetical protein [Deltaproteobacteria bacterium]